MLNRDQIAERLAAKLPGTERRVATGREREALETAQKLGNLMDRYTDWADLACACHDAELARDEALVWLRGEVNDAT
jgi:hypothetical protein